MFRGKKWEQLLPGSKLPKLKAPRKPGSGIRKYPLSIKKEKPPKVAPWKRVLPDGREILSTVDPAGWAEYKARIRQMWERQGGVCCLARHCPLCPGKLRFEDATFEHEGGRGMAGSKRDDRIVNSEGLKINGAAHYQCNRWKASRKITYNRP